MATQQLTIPLFPLNVVVLPGETMPLHIFEERYKQLINDCLQNEACFGIPFMNNKQMGQFGMEVRIHKVSKIYDNGELDIIIEGVRPFELMEFSSVLSPKLYGAGIVKYESLNLQTPKVLLQDLVKDFLWLSQSRVIPEDAFDNANIYSVARLLDLTNQEKYQLIASTTLKDKEKMLISSIRLFIHLIKTEEQLKNGFTLN